ncbi:MAG: arginine repressor [Acidimicrobiales bacterium]
MEPGSDDTPVGRSRTAKVQRQYKLTKLLSSKAVSSQATLVEMLAADGVSATQATVSRDLEELGAVKVRVGGGETVYAIPERIHDRSLPQDHLRRVMGEWVGEVASAANLVVLRTPPGSAHVVASALDRAGLADVLGTVAGDDTVLVVAAEGERGLRVARRLRLLAGLQEVADDNDREENLP